MGADVEFSTMKLLGVTFFVKPPRWTNGIELVYLICSVCFIASTNGFPIGPFGSAVAYGSRVQNVPGGRIPSIGNLPEIAVIEGRIPSIPRLQDLIPQPSSSSSVLNRDSLMPTLLTPGRFIHHEIMPELQPEINGGVFTGTEVDPSRISDATFDSLGDYVGSQSQLDDLTKEMKMELEFDGLGNPVEKENPRILFDLPRNEFDEIDKPAVKAFVQEKLLNFGVDNRETVDDTYDMYSMRNVKTGATYYGSHSKRGPCEMWKALSGSEFFTTPSRGSDQYQYLGAFQFKITGSNPYAARQGANIRAFYSQILQHMGYLFGVGYAEPDIKIFKTWEIIWSIEEFATFIADDIKNGRVPENAILPPNKFLEAIVSSSTITELQQTQPSVFFGSEELKDLVFNELKDVMESSTADASVDEQEAEENEIKALEEGDDEEQNEEQTIRYKDGKNRQAVYFMWNKELNLLYVGTTVNLNHPCRIWKRDPTTGLYSRKHKDGDGIIMEGYEYVGNIVYATTGNRYDSIAAADSHASYIINYLKVASELPGSKIPKSANILLKKKSSDLTLEKLSELMTDDFANQLSPFQILPPKLGYVDYSKLEIEKINHEPKSYKIYENTADLASAIGEFEKSDRGPEALTRIFKQYNLKNFENFRRTLRKHRLGDRLNEYVRLYTEEDLLKVVELKNGGMTYAEIEREFPNIPRDTITYRIENPNAKPQLKLTPETKQAILKDLADGHKSVRYFTDKYPVGARNVYKIMKKYRNSLKSK